MLRPDNRQSYVLFSPLGASDPIRNNHDGPMLHIVRQYRPKKVVLFFSAELQALDERDNRYEICIKRLAGPTPGQPIEVKKIYSGLRDVHLFGVCDSIFEKHLRDLHQQNPEACILLNLSSGTPQMIASLYLLAATLPFETKPLQVETPMGAANRIVKTIDTETEWESLLDNIEDEGDRTRKVGLEAVRRKLKSPLDRRE